MDHSDLDKAYSCAKAADASTLSGDFIRAARAHSEAAELFAQAAAASPENPGVAVLEALAKQHRSRATYFSSGKAKQQPIAAASIQNSPVVSPGASMRISRTIESIDDVVARATNNICRTLDAALNSRDSSESFYLVDSVGDIEAAKRSARAMVKQEMNILAKELRDRDQRVQEQYDESRRRIRYP